MTLNFSLPFFLDYCTVLFRSCVVQYLQRLLKLYIVSSESPSPPFWMLELVSWTRGGWLYTSYNSKPAKRPSILLANKMFVLLWLNYWGVLIGCEVWLDFNPNHHSDASNSMDRVVASHGERTVLSLPPPLHPLSRIETPADASHLLSTIACFFAAFFQPKYGPIWYVARTSFLRVIPQFPV